MGDRAATPPGPGRSRWARPQPALPAPAGRPAFSCGRAGVGSLGREPPGSRVQPAATGGGRRILSPGVGRGGARGNVRQPHSSLQTLLSAWGSPLLACPLNPGCNEESPSEWRPVSASFPAHPEVCVIPICSALLTEPSSPPSHSRGLALCAETPILHSRRGQGGGRRAWGHTFGFAAHTRLPGG